MAMELFSKVWKLSQGETSKSLKHIKKYYRFQKSLGKLIRHWSKTSLKGIGGEEVDFLLKPNTK